MQKMAGGPKQYILGSWNISFNLYENWLEYVKIFPDCSTGKKNKFRREFFSALYPPNFESCRKRTRIFEVHVQSSYQRSFMLPSRNIWNF